MPIIEIMMITFLGPSSRSYFLLTSGSPIPSLHPEPLQRRTVQMKKLRGWQSSVWASATRTLGAAQQGSHERGPIGNPWQSTSSGTAKRRAPPQQIQ